MCGIAGYSLSPRATIDRLTAARILVAGIAERGADATGACVRCARGRTHVVKARGGASRLLPRLALPLSAREALLHVRDHTKGHPRVEPNNHPIRHGPVVGIHNGTIDNDEAVLAAHAIQRHDRRATVDSEAIFALAARYRRSPAAFAELRGSLACAWLDERLPRRLFLARGLARPLWLGLHRDGLYFASTPDALSLLEELAGIDVDLVEVGEGTWLEIADGRVVAAEAFALDRDYVPRRRPPVRSPGERHACLGLLRTEYRLEPVRRPQGSSSRIARHAGASAALLDPPQQPCRAAARD